MVLSWSLISIDKPSTLFFFFSQNISLIDQRHVVQVSIRLKVVLVLQRVNVKFSVDKVEVTETFVVMIDTISERCHERDWQLPPEASRRNLCINAPEETSISHLYDFMEPRVFSYESVHFSLMNVNLLSVITYFFLHEIIVLKLCEKGIAPITKVLNVMWEYLQPFVEL